MYRTFQDLVFGHIEQDARINELEKRVYRIRGENNDKFVMLEDFMNKYYMEQQINQIRGIPIEQVYSNKFEVDKTAEIDAEKEEDKFRILEVYTIGNSMALINTERKTGESNSEGGITVPNYDHASYLLKFNETDRKATFTQIEGIYLTNIYLIVNDIADTILFIVNKGSDTSCNIYQFNYTTNEIQPPTPQPISNSHTKFIYTYIEKDSIGSPATEVILQSDQDTGSATNNLKFSVSYDGSTFASSITTTSFNRTTRYIDFDNYIAFEFGQSSDKLYYNAKQITNDSSINIDSFRDLKLFVNKEPYIDTNGSEFDKDSIFMYDAGYYKVSDTAYGTNNIYILHPVYSDSDGTIDNYSVCDVILTFEYDGPAISGTSGETTINNSNAIISNNCGLIMDNIALFRRVIRNQYIPATVKLYSHNSDFFFSTVTAEKAALIKVEQNVDMLASREDKTYIITKTVNDYDFKYDIKTQIAGSTSETQQQYHYIERIPERIKETDYIYICGVPYAVYKKSENNFYILYMHDGACDQTPIYAVKNAEGDTVETYKIPMKLYTADPVAETSTLSDAATAKILIGESGIEFTVKEGKADSQESATNPYHYITPFVINRIDSSEIGKILTKEDAAESIYTLFGESGYLINKIQPN